MGHAMTVRRAVCIGINDYPGGGSLNGAVNDAKAWAEVLAGRFGCTQVQVLIDRAATAAGIRHAMATLLEGAEPDDALVVTLAGHGSMAAGSVIEVEVEPVFCPFDLQSHRVPLREILALGRQLPERAHLSVVLDASFAVTITRTAVTEDEVAVTPGSDVRRRSLFPAAFRARTSAHQVPDEKAFERPPRTVLLAAAGVTECSHEAFFRRAYRGALSWHATEYLRTSPPGTRWRDLMRQLAMRLPSASTPQKPRLLAPTVDQAQPVFFATPA
jgi:hypothetical protein